MNKGLFGFKSNRVKGLLELVLDDVCGFMNVKARGEYYITFINDYSGYGYEYLMRRDGETFD